MWQLILVLALLIPILAIVLDSEVGRALAARLKTGSENDARSVLAERVQFLEGEVERLSEEVDRLAEEGRFLERLLEERSGEPGRLTSGEAGEPAVDDLPGGRRPIPGESGEPEPPPRRDAPPGDRDEG